MSEWKNLEDDQIGVLGVTQLPVPMPTVPSVIELRDDYLYWSNPSTTQPVVQTEIFVFPNARGEDPTEKHVPVQGLDFGAEALDFIGALDRFARLRTGKDVLRFAQRFGVLDICEHGLPCTHNPRLLSIPLLGLIQSPSLWKPVEVGIEQDPSFLIVEHGERTWCESTGMEAIEIWLFWSRMAAAILNITTALRRDVPTNRADWEVVITEESEDWDLLKGNYSFSFKNEPGAFHNGGIWPVWMGLFCLGLAKNGLQKEAETIIAGFTETIS